MEASPELSGFGNTLASEALPGALPRAQNTPRELPYGLYPESLNGTPFTTARGRNQRTWMYRIRPSVQCSELSATDGGAFHSDFSACSSVPSLLRWGPVPLTSGSDDDFVDGLRTLGGSPPGTPGYAIHAFAAHRSMGDRAFYDADGDLLIVPQQGDLSVRTELGVLEIAPGEVVIVPRGIKFSVSVKEPSRGFVLETLDSPLVLPERGLIGSNSLADERHFLAPSAAFEDRHQPGYRITAKLDGKVWEGRQDHSPFDVVAWFGRHVPFKYDLSLFNALGSVTFDHPDPSLLTVLTCPACDFAVFPPRWEVAEHSFRPPYFHRNAATEFNVVLRDPRPPEGFEPGCCTLSPLLSPHGITTSAFDAEMARTSDAPSRMSDETLWVQFESKLPFRVTPWALDAPHRDRAYAKVFRYSSRFRPTR